jgi:NitT/TauT family transport system permease protein
MRWLAGIGAVLMAVGLLLPANSTVAEAPSLWLAAPSALVAAWLAVFAAFAAALPIDRPPGGPAARLAGVIGAFLVAAARFGRIFGGSVLILASLLLGAPLPLVIVLHYPGIGLALPGLWLFLLGLGLIAWGSMELLAHRGSWRGPLALAAPLLFGLWLLYVWEVAVVGFGVPQILLPAPHQIGHQLVDQANVLWGDFRQTFLKAVLAGWAAGCGLGFVAAVAIDRVPFLQRGLLPLGNLVSAVPVVGIAPIMVMWFGFDWPSKAAVIVVMTFFPMLINTIAGFSQVDAMGRDMMQSYGASYWQTFFKLRLPSALPFIFNALKINSTLAMIGAIVAEFFGSPIAGMGFRISVEVARMDVDVVWATIAVAAVAGSLFYWLIALLERGLTFWHPSYRE